MAHKALSLALLLGFTLSLQGCGDADEAEETAATAAPAGGSAVFVSSSASLSGLTVAQATASKKPIAAGIANGMSVDASKVTITAITTAAARRLAGRGLGGHCPGVNCDEITVAFDVETTDAAAVTAAINDVVVADLATSIKDAIYDAPVSDFTDADMADYVKSAALTMEVSALSAPVEKSTATTIVEPTDAPATEAPPTDKPTDKPTPPTEAPCPTMAPDAGCVDDECAMVAKVASMGSTIEGCADIAQFCDHEEYGPITQPLCPVTCGSCPTECPPAAPDAGCVDDDCAMVAKVASMGSTIESCADVAQFCDHEEYGPITQPLCPVTCGSCPSEAPTEAPTTAEPVDGTNSTRRLSFEFVTSDEPLLL